MKPIGRFDVTPQFAYLCVRKALEKNYIAILGYFWRNMRDTRNFLLLSQELTARTIRFTHRYKKRCN